MPSTLKEDFKEYFHEHPFKSQGWQMQLLDNNEDIRNHLDFESLKVRLFDEQGYALLTYLNVLKRQ